jgi:hypothetical protein
MLITYCFSKKQGLLGSIAFVREYLIPRELIDKKANFLGAYVIDMALNYDPTPGSQSLPRDIMIVSQDKKTHTVCSSFSLPARLSKPQVNLIEAKR